MASILNVELVVTPTNGARWYVAEYRCGDGTTHRHRHYDTEAQARKAIREGTWMLEDRSHPACRLPYTREEALADALRELVDVATQCYDHCMCPQGDLADAIERARKALEGV